MQHNRLPVTGELERVGGGLQVFACNGDGVFARVFAVVGTRLLWHHVLKAGNRRPSGALTYGVPGVGQD